MAKKPIIAGDLLNALGERGEKMAYLALTNFSLYKEPLFKPAFLGDKWPTADFYAELELVKKSRPVALFQVKTTAAVLKSNSKNIKVALSKQHVNRLAGIPIPAYVLGVSEKTQRVFIRFIEKDRKEGLSIIRISNELTPKRLKELHAEITTWWGKPKKFQSSFL